MLPLLKNRLDLLIGTKTCHSRMLGPWPTRTVLQEEVLSDTSVRALQTMLSKLAETKQLPASARLVLGTDHVCTALIAGTLTRAKAQEQAQAKLSDALGTNAVSIALSLLPGGRYWLAAAIADAVVQPWIDTLVANKVRISSITAEISEQLAQLPSLTLPSQAILAFPSASQATLVFLDDGEIAGIDWEDRGGDQAAQLAERAKAAWHRLRLPEMKSPSLIAALSVRIDDNTREQFTQAGFQVQALGQGAWHAQH